MKRLTIALAAACLAGGVLTATASPADAATLCVGGSGCFQTVQAAFDAAANGDTIRIGQGTFAGGATVRVSVDIIGAGAGRTIIRGGGPVLTVGESGAANADKLTVSIRGVTITGGLTTSAPTPNGPITFVAIAGGVLIPSGPPGTIGATVTIRDSAITGNRVTPTSAVGGSAESCAGGGDCPFAQAIGAGIADIGRLTLINTLVSDNVAGGPLVSNAAGGGIWTATNGGPGSLTLIDSTVTRNSARVSAPNGRFAEGGGIEVQDGESFSSHDSVISNNKATVTNTFPAGVELFANSGGIHIGGFGSATIEGTRISGNTVSADDPAGAPGAVDAALSVGLSDSCVCGQTLVLRNSELSGNSTLLNAGSSDAGPSGAALEIDGQASVSGTVIRDNRTTVTAHAGSAAAFGAFLAFDGESQPIVVRDSVIRGNRVSVSTGTRRATVQGGGLTNGGALQLHDVAINDNVGTAVAASGFAQGGGIWNGQPFGPDGAPTPQLTLDDVAVIRNTVAGSAAVTLQGGGIFTTFSLGLDHSRVTMNTPDQCFGC
jgi:hypothetical protein